MLRKRFLEGLPNGAVYVPFCGDGDITSELYRARACFCADIDPERVAAAKEKLRGMTKVQVVAADCNAWPFHGCSDRFALVDCDAWVNPYPAIAAFWNSAKKSETIAIVATDAQRENIKRSKHAVKLPECSRIAGNWREQCNFWWLRYVKPWLAGLVAGDGYAIQQESKFGDRYGTMLYWAVILAKRPGITEVAVKRQRKKRARFDAGKQERYLDEIRGGAGHCEAAQACGVSPDSVERAMHNDRALAAAVSAAEVTRDGKRSIDVERALYEAATNGNTTAIIFWLQNRLSDRWQDKRGMGGASLSVAIDQRDVSIQLGCILQELIEEKVLSKDKARALIEKWASDDESKG